MTQNLITEFVKRAKESPEDIAISQLLPVNDLNCSLPRECREYRNKEIFSISKKIAHYLDSIGIEKEERVSIVSNTRPEWVMSDIGIMSCGAVVTSIYQTLTAKEIAYILYDSGSKVVFAENQEQVDKILGLVDIEVDIPKVEDRPAHKAKLNIKKIITFEEVDDHELVISLDSILACEEKEFISPKIDSEDLASLVYTSGTTGAPKGVPQTHANHLANIRQISELDFLEKSTSLFLFLPLAHSFAKLMSYTGLYSDIELKFPSIIDKKSSKFDPKKLSIDMRDSNASIIPIVPRILEKVQEALQQRAKEETIAGKLLSLTLSSLDQESYKDKVVNQLMFPIKNKVKRGLFGNNFVSVISGGAKLAETTNEFYESLGIPVLQGYGLTETCVATNVNSLHKNKIGTVGKVLSTDIEIKLTEENEILFRGPNVTKGYYNRPIATKEAWDKEGWFHTGDLGEIDSEGYLKIVGRKKELLVSSYGKKIAPVDIEDEIKTSPYITDALLVGDARPYCVALLAVDKSITEGLSKEEINNLIQKEINKTNKYLANYQEVKRFRIIPEEFTVENGFLTPTFKIKRNIVVSHYSDLIEDIYTK